MKIIDAYWEERNLGMKVCELVIDRGENFDENLLSGIEESYDYIIAKIPGDSISLMHQLEEKGFRYLENQQVIYFLSDQIQRVNGEWENRFRDVKCEKVNELVTLEKICNKIRSGLYLKGRISADPLIGKGISDMRIVNWLHDLYLKNGVTIYALEKGKDLIGYFALEKVGERNQNIVQAGIFSDFQNKGYSFLILYNVLMIANLNSYKGIFSTISTGNTRTMNSISRFVNFTVKETYIVARKMTCRSHK